jgi:prepilin-type N-terminal cleavage/methylation domain-containing protein
MPRIKPWFRDKMTSKTKNSQGFSLIELLIVIAILGVILTGIYSLFMSANKSQISQDLEVEMQQNARSAMDFIVRELRNMMPLTPLSNCLENTSNTCATSGDKIQFTSMTDTTYSRTFSWSSTDNILRFLNPSISPVREKLADNITAISFTPFDANNISTTSLDSVQRIDITLTARTSMIDPNTNGYRYYSTTTSVKKRN